MTPSINQPTNRQNRHTHFLRHAQGSPPHAQEDLREAEQLRRPEGHGHGGEGAAEDDDDGVEKAGLVCWGVGGGVG